MRYDGDACQDTFPYICISDERFQASVALNLTAADGSSARLVVTEVLETAAAAAAWTPPPGRYAGVPAWDEPLTCCRNAAAGTLVPGECSRYDVWGSKILLAVCFVFAAAPAVSVLVCAAGWAGREIAWARQWPWYVERDARKRRAADALREARAAADAAARRAANRRRQRRPEDDEPAREALRPLLERARALSADVFAAAQDAGRPPQPGAVSPDAGRLERRLGEIRRDHRELEGREVADLAKRIRTGDAEYAADEALESARAALNHARAPLFTLLRVIDEKLAEMRGGAPRRPPQEEETAAGL